MLSFRTCEATEEVLVYTTENVDRRHRIVDQLADCVLFGVGLKVRPAGPLSAPRTRSQPDIRPGPRQRRRLPPAAFIPSAIFFADSRPRYGSNGFFIKAAPFQRKDGTPYLEPHHIQRLADEGPDHPKWVGAVCPSCHREIHPLVLCQFGYCRELRQRV